MEHRLTPYGVRLMPTAHPYLPIKEAWGEGMGCPTINCPCGYMGHPSHHSHSAHSNSLALGGRDRRPAPMLGVWCW